MNHLEMLEALYSADIDFEPIDADALQEAALEFMLPHERVVLVAGPRASKTTIAARASERYKIKARHADALIHSMPFASDEEPDMADEVSNWLNEPGRWIVEGVVTARAIRRWLAAHPDGPVPFAVVRLPKAIQLRTEKQESMSKGVDTVWSGIESELISRGAKIFTPSVLTGKEQSVS